MLPVGRYDLMLVAGAAAEVAGAGLTPKITTKESALAALKVAETGKWSRNTIPMWGYTDGVPVGDASPDVPLRIAMYRMLARVDVLLSKTGASGTGNGEGNDNFALTDVMLVNYNTVGRIAPDYTDPAVWSPKGDVANGGKGIAIAPSLPASAGKQSGMAASSPWAPAQWYTAADGVTANAFERGIYTFEAANGNAASHDTNPCVIVGGSYRGGATSWYRVDFIERGGTDAAPTYSYLDLLRNHSYRITIGKVTNPGYATPKEAFDSRGFNIEAEWEDGNTIESGFDGQYTLAISQNRYDFGGAGGTQTLTVRTDYPGGWKAKVCDAEGNEISSPWVTLDPPSGTGEIVNITAGPNPADADARTARIHVTAGRITLKVEVTQTAAE